MLIEYTSRLQPLQHSLKQLLISFQSPNLVLGNCNPLIKGSMKKHVSSKIVKFFNDVKCSSDAFMAEKYWQKHFMADSNCFIGYSSLHQLIPGVYEMYLYSEINSESLSIKTSYFLASLALSLSEEQKYPA